MEVGGRIVRAIKIVKMRGSDFDEVLRPYRITDRGIVVYPDLSVSEV
ncbi:ATPase domain-containing protein [Archaeoglobus sp.]